MTNTIKIKCNAENTLELAELTEFQGGLKQRTDIDYDKIKLSICKYGFSFPFFVWKNGSKNYLLDGHGRFATLCKMQKDGYTIPPLPVVYVSCKDKKEAKEKLLRLNSQYGKMTKESVLEFCSDIELNFDEIALPDTVIDFTDATEPQETEGDDEAPEVDEKSEPVSKRGEMYELGNSILMCGDTTNAEDVARLVGNSKADLLITDPPYNVAIVGGSHALTPEQIKKQGKLSIKNDSMGKSDFREFLIKCFSVLKENIKEGASFYIWYASSEAYNFNGACADVGLDVKQELIWNKSSLVMGKQDYQWKHEPCLYGWRAGAGHSWYNDRKQTTIIDCKRPMKSTLHPTMKPVELFEYQIGNSTKEGDIVLDGFGGSGTTVIACEKLHRKARVMELDPKYCDVIRKRYTQWAKENGKPITSGCLE
jgi:site-specific DNA-methyltransferase (adenine-specific)